VVLRLPGEREASGGGGYQAPGGMKFARPTKSRLVFVRGQSGRVIWFKLAKDRTIVDYGYVRRG
jgi:hypothetical protein